MAKDIEFTIKPNGEVEVDQQGYKGKNCSGDISEILNALGKEKSRKRKKEWYEDNRVKISRGG